MNEKYLQDLYGWIKGQDPSYEGRYSYDQFKQKMQDETYATQMHGWISDKDETFSQRRPLSNFVQQVKAVSPMATKPVVEQPKKKEATVSPFVAGGSELTKFDPRTGQVVQDTPAFAQKQPEVTVPKQKLPERTEFQFQPGKPLPAQKAAPLPKFVEEQLTAVTPDLIGKTEENVVPQLKYQFGPLGFKFEETGAGDYMIATSPSGESIEVSLDITDIDGKKAEANKLNAFLRKGATTVKNISTLQKQYVDANKKITSQKELDDSLASINAEEANIMAKNTEFAKLQTSLESERARLESVPPQQRNNPEYIARVNDFISRADQFSNEFQTFVKDAQDLDKRGQQLNKSIGKYTEMKAQQGTWYGAGLNAVFNKSIYDMAKGFSGIAIDFLGEVIPTKALMSQDDYEKNFIEQARKEGVAIAEGEDFTSITSRLSPETLANIENRVRDVAKKTVRGEFIGDLDKTSKMAMESSGVSPEYYRSIEETFVGGALLGALSSIPAMAGGPVARTVLMGSQVLAGLDAEMANDPAFADVSENEKYLVKGPIAVAVALLENAGLSNLLNQKGFLNGLVLKALGKVGVGASYKTFGEVIKNEIDSAVGRGALTLGAGFLAEAETGTLQEVVDIGAKSIYNKAKEKEMFDTPDSVVQFIEQVGKAGLQEGIGAGVLAVPGSVSAAYRGKGFLGMDDAQFAMFEKMANDSNIEKGFVARLKSRINAGEITASEGKEILDNYNNSVSLFNSLPDNLDMKGKKQAMNLLKERRDLERQIAGKDQALTTPQRNRVTQINEQLTKLSEDAIQEQAAGEVPVQPGTGVSQEVAQGEPQAEPQGVTQEGQVQEVVDPLKNVESTTKALANGVRDTAGIITNRDSFNNIYDIVRAGDLFSDVREKARKEGGGIPQRAIAEKYHESKANGTNPDFVQVVESAFIRQTPAQQKAIPASIQPEIDTIEAQRRQELEANKAGLDKPYYLGETEGPTLGEVINQKYDTQIDELKAKSAPQQAQEVVPLKDVENTTLALQDIAKENLDKVEKILGDDIVYHGTKEDFEEFDETKIGATDDGWYGKGFYFHSDRNRGGYGDIVKAAKIDLKNPIVLPVQDSGQYLYDIIGKEANLDESFRNEGSQNIIREIGSDNFTKTAKKLGYDGVIVNYAQGTQEVVAFNKDSIKQANPKSISEAYHKAKADGSNPELVRTVENLLSKEVAPTQEVITEQVTPQQIEKQRADLDMEVKALEDLLSDPNEEPLFKKSDNDTKFGESADVVEDVVRQINELPSGNVTTTITPKPQKPIDIDDLESRADVPVKRTTFDVIKGIPAVFSISDQLRIGNVTNPNTGNVIDRLFGGLGFGFTKGHEEFGWANTTEDEGTGIVNKAVSVYNNNKALYDDWWAKNPEYNGLVPLNIVKMAEGSIMSNEALYRVLKDNFASFPKKNKVDALNYLVKTRIPSVIDSKNKSLSKPDITPNSIKSAEKVIKSLNTIQDKIKSRKIKSIDQLLEPEFYIELSLPVRAELISQLTTGSPNKAGEQKSSGLPGENTVPRALLGVDQEASLSAKAIGKDNLNKVSLSNATDIITEPSMRDVEPRQIIAIYGVDVLNPAVKETVHPNYKFGINGRPIGVLENSVSIQEAYPFAYTNILESLIAKEIKTGEKLKAAPINSLINEKIPVGIGLPNLEFIGAISQGVMSNAQKLSAWINKSFPSVIMSTDAETFANVLKSEGVRVQLKGDEVVYGVTVDGDIYINPDVHNSDSALFNTTIHEFGHVWLNFLETTAEGKRLLNRGVDLVKKTGEYQDQLKKFNGNQTKAANEALAILIGNRGETIVNASLKSKFQEWLLGMWKYVKDKFKLSGDLTPQEIQDLTLDQFLGTAIADLFSGKALPIGELQLKKLKNPEAAFSKSDSIDSIVQRGRANGFSEESINVVLQKRGFTQEAIDAALGKAEPAAKKVEVTEEFAPGYNRVLNEIFGKDGVVARSRRRGRSEEETMQNAIDYLEQDTKVYENATDVQREAMVRNLRKEFKKREKAAPSAEKVIGKPKKKEVTVDEMVALKDQIKLEARAAREAKGDLNKKRKALADKVSALNGKGTVTTNQIDTIVKRIERTNLDNPIMVDRLLAYIEKVFDNANYAADMAELRKLQKQARSRNHTSMTNVVKQFTSINPENIPLDRIQEYKKALDFLNNLTPSYATMNEILDEMLSYQVTEEFDAVKTLEALQNKYESIQLNEVGSVEEYRNLIKDINSFKRKAFQLLQNEEITQEQYDDLIKMVGKDQQTIEEDYKDEITKIKKDLIAEIKNQRPKVSRDFSNVENDLIRKYLELSDADLQSLSPEDLFVLNDLLENISNGEIDNFRFNEIISKAYTSDGANRLAKQIDDSKFDMTPEEGTKELSEYESSFWEGLLGMGRAKSGALQKFVVSVFNRAIASYENLTRDGYNEFLKIKNKYKISDKDMHKIGMLTTYLQEHMAQFDPKNEGIKDIGKRDWFKEILNNKSMRGKYSSGKPSILKVIGLGKSEIDIIEEIWDSLPKDKDGNVNPEAVYNSYMANDGKFFTKNEKGFFDDVMAYKTSEITPKQKFANEINGSSFKEIPFHMMRVRLDGGKTQITPTASSDNGVVRIKAGTGKERVSEAVGPIMTNFEKLFITNLEQTGRDYFLSGALKDINNTLSGAKKKIDPDKMPVLDTISGTLSEALGYEFDRTRTEMILRSLLSARAATTLLNPIRTAMELGATLSSYPLRAKTLSGYKDLFGKQKEMSKLLEFTNSPLRLRQNINNAIDINDGRIEPQSRLTKATAYLSGLPERTMMVTSWMPTFRSEFKDITGLDFDMKKFNDSSAYREKYGKAVKEGSAVADAQTEKIIGPTTKAGQRREVRLLPKVLANIIGLEGTVPKNTAAGQILGFFSNYPYREVTEFVNGFKEAAEVIKDEGALSSLSQLQKPLGIALNVAAYGFLGSLTYAGQLILLGDDDDEERGNKILKDIMTTEGFLNELASNAISLAGSKYAAGGKALLQLAATIAIESTDDEEQKAKIKKLLKDSVFVDPLPVEKATKFGGREKALSAIGMYIPQFVILADRYADLIGGINEFGAIYDKVESKGVESLTQDEGTKILALNTIFNASQIVLNLAGTSIPAYNYIKTYMNKLKEDAGVADVYKGEAPAKKKSSGGGGGGGKSKSINKTDLKRYFPEQYNQLYGEGSPTYEIEQEIKAFEKEQRELKKSIKDQIYGGN